MKILVIGGSYFYGRVFVMLAAKEHNITVVNRGTYSMAEFGVDQVKGHRRDTSVWRQCRENYDVVVDFCAYNAGDITCVLENIAGSVSQYIMISTVDVYRRGTGLVKDENSPVETRQFPGEAGDYIAGKVALENELREQCNNRDIHWKLLRPAILYGPYNYAPRESLYIQMAVQKQILPQITDAEGRFQLVYVKDAAQALLNCLGNPKAFGQAYNLCQDGSLNYQEFSMLLMQAAKVFAVENASKEGKDSSAERESSAERGSVSEKAPEPEKELTVVPMTVSQAKAQGVPLPFPVNAEETEEYTNEKSIRELGLTYTPLSEGMIRTYRAFAGVFGV